MCCICHLSNLHLMYACFDIIRITAAIQCQVTNVYYTRFYEYKDKGGGLCPEVTKYTERKLSHQYTLLKCQNKVRCMEGLKIGKDMS